MVNHFHTPFTCQDYTNLRMPRQLRDAIALLMLGLCAVVSFASAYNAQPKLVVIVVVDQLRGDLLERYHDDFTDGGFRLLMDHGAWFTSCYYNYAATKTAPGHSTIGTGTYALGHGILANEWWDPSKRRVVTSVEDEGTKTLGLLNGAEGEKWSSSPHNLQTDTIGDELKLATGGKAKVYLDAYPDLVFPAHVEFVSPVAAAGLGTPIKTFVAVFRIDKTDPRLLPDLSAAILMEPTSAAGGAK